MGLDVSFDRQAALDAGLVITIERRGTDAEIAEAKAAVSGEQHPGYLPYLESKEKIVHVPNTDIRVSEHGDTTTIVVRANRWGRVYQPLTDWLSTNDILWDEY